MAVPSLIDDVAAGGYAGYRLTEITKLPREQWPALAAAAAEGQDVVSRFLAGAWQQGGEELFAEVVAYLKRVNLYTNAPGAIKNSPKLVTSPALERAALAAVDTDATRLAVLAGSYPIIELWALVATAIRADAGLLDRLDEAWGDLDGVPKKLVDLDKALAKYREAQAAPEPAPAAAPATPQKPAEVKQWLADHPDADPAVLAAQPGMKAAARAAAVRALAEIGGPAAFEVIKGYAEKGPATPVEKEIIKAWPKFDAEAFAVAMFLPIARQLNLAEVGQVDGLQAVPELRDLRIHSTKKVDLAPLAGCTQLRRLALSVAKAPSIAFITELPELTYLNMEEAADLAPVASSTVVTLGLFAPVDLAPLLKADQLRQVNLFERAASDPQSPRLLVELARRGVAVVAHQSEAAALQSAAQAAGAHVEVINRLVVLAADSEAAATAAEQYYGPRVI